MEDVTTSKEAGSLTPPSGQTGTNRQPVCSIVIPTYNGRRLLGICLGAVFGNLSARERDEVEVIVVDDASTDDTAAWIEATYPRVRLIRLDRNGGFCAAANAGLNAARGEFIQLLNNDTEVTPGWLAAGLAPFDDPTVGSVAPLVLVRSNPRRVDSAGDSYSIAGWPTKRGHGQDAAVWTDHEDDEVFAASGSSAFYRAEAVRKTGGFDALLGSYYEDVDLGFRLRWAGYRCVFTGRSRILHEISATYNHAQPGLQRRMARNSEIVFWSNMPGRRLIAALPAHLALTIAQGAWRMLRLRFIPFYLGKIDALRNLRAVWRRRQQRAELSRHAVAPPRFPMGLGGPGDLINHLRRPKEQSSLQAAPRGPHATPRPSVRKEQTPTHSER